MKYLDEYRDAPSARKFAQAIRRITTRPHRIMEICGGQTHAILRFGIDELLPPQISLIHGPGCPVCVTPVDMIDKALEIAAMPDVTFCSFGDMLRVPGSNHDLFQVKSQGGDVRMVYSPLDAVQLASENPERRVVFFAVGFETTAPVNALAVVRAKQRGLTNFFMLVSHVLLPPAVETILGSPNNRVQGLLAAGHVCAIMGCEEYEPIAKRYHVPIVVTGFEPVDILQGIFQCVKQLEEGRAEVENPYARCVNTEGNASARSLITKVFQVVPRTWRGIGEIPKSGLGLREEFACFDAELEFQMSICAEIQSTACIAGLVLQGIKKPEQCPEFGTSCLPDRPLGAPMVSAEGACAAYYRYRKRRDVS